MTKFGVQEGGSTVAGFVPFERTYEGLIRKECSQRGADRYLKEAYQLLNPLIQAIALRVCPDRNESNPQHNNISVCLGGSLFNPDKYFKIDSKTKRLSFAHDPVERWSIDRARKIQETIENGIYVNPKTLTKTVFTEPYFCVGLAPHDPQNPHQLKLRAELKIASNFFSEELSNRRHSTYEQAKNLMYTSPRCLVFTDLVIVAHEGIQYVVAPVEIQKANHFTEGVAHPWSDTTPVGLEHLASFDRTSHSLFDLANHLKKQLRPDVELFAESWVGNANYMLVDEGPSALFARFVEFNVENPNEISKKLDPNQCYALYILGDHQVDHPSFIVGADPLGRVASDVTMSDSMQVIMAELRRVRSN